MNVHREDQPLNEDALAKIAVDLYQRDKENQETEGAVRGALHEMQIPDTYYEAAKAELYRRQMAKDAKRAAVQRVLHFVAPLLIVVAAVSIPSFLNLFHKPEPFTLGFADPTNWSLEVNDGTIARKDDIRIGSQSGTRLTVNRFARSTTSNFPGQFWVQENTTKGPFDLRKLNEATFVARGQGLTNVRLRFNSGSEDWVSEPIVLSDHFQPYRINLNALWENKMAGSQFISQGLSRVDDKPQTISIQVGQYVNAFRSQGFVEVSEIQFK